MPRKQHIHKYYLRRTAAGDFWTCALLGCNHFMPLYLTPMVPGRTSLCWDCESKFHLLPELMDLDKPLCGVCRDVYNAREQERLNKIKEIEDANRYSHRDLRVLEPEINQREYFTCVKCGKKQALVEGQMCIECV